MNDKKILISLVVFIVLLLGGSVMLLGSSPQPKKIEYSQKAKVQINETSFNWGNINFEGPKATKTFKIKNTGEVPLQLTNIKTSCTCTTAQVVIDGNQSPLFSMHGSSRWLGEVQPGREAELVIVFDQRFHGPSGVGPIERFITLETNDINRKKLEFNLKGNVIKN